MASLDTRIELPMFGDTIAIPTYFIERVKTDSEIDSSTGLYKKDKKGNTIKDYVRDENGEIKTTKIYQKDKNGEYIRDKKGHRIITGRTPLVYTKKVWVIDNVGNESINKTRQLSSRKGQKFLDLGIGEVNKIKDINVVRRPYPTLKDFPNQHDRDLLVQVIKHPATRLSELNKNYPENKTRGRPPILKKNWDYHGLGELPEAYKKHKGKGKSKEKEDDDKPFSWDDYPDTPESESPREKSISPKINLGAGGGSGYPPSPSQSPPASPPKEKKGRGRPVKHLTEEDKYKAKLQSNKDKRAERRIEERRKKIAEKLEKGEKLTKKERDLHEGEMEGEGIDFEDIKWNTFTDLYKRFLDKHPQFKDKIEDLEHFADFVLENKDKFSKKAEKKALFYNNIISNK
jgi:hypothetical protein